MQETDTKAVVEEYLQAFEERDLARCLGFFTEDATIHWVVAKYSGRQEIEGWHKDRFDAEMRPTRIDEIRVKGNRVYVDATATSKRAKIWRMDSLAGTATFIFDGGKIKEVKFGLRTSLPIEGWR